MAPLAPFLFMRLRHIHLGLFCLLLLGGCASRSPVAQVTAQLLGGTLGGSTASIDSMPTNPAFSYLRVKGGNRAPSMLVRGYIESPAAGAQHVWYSAHAEVIKTSAGRVVATGGLPHNRVWVGGAASIPQWADVGSGGAFYARTLDYPSKHVYNLQQRIKVERWASAPAEPGWVVDPAFKPSSGQNVVWFKETVQPDPASTAENSAAPVQSDWYAVNMAVQPPVVLYSYQCLAADSCFHIQPWSRERQ